MRLPNLDDYEDCSEFFEETGIRVRSLTSREDSYSDALLQSYFDDNLEIVFPKILHT